MESFTVLVSIQNLLKKLKRVSYPEISSKKKTLNILPLVSMVHSNFNT